MNWIDCLNLLPISPYLEGMNPHKSQLLWLSPEWGFDLNNHALISMEFYMSTELFLDIWIYGRLALLFDYIDQIAMVCLKSRSFWCQIQDVWFSNPKFSFLNPNSWWLNQLNHHIPALEWSHFNLSVIKSRFWWPQGNPTHRCEKSTICRRFSYGKHGFSISFCTFTLGYLQFFIKSHSSRWRERPVLVRLPPVQGMWREQASVSGGMRCL